VDPLLAAFAADVDWLGTQGVTVTRHNLAQEPQAFVSNPLVQQTLQREGDACLPLVLVNGEIAARGAYPRRDELARLAGLVATASSTKPRSSFRPRGAARLTLGAADGGPAVSAHPRDVLHREGRRREDLACVRHRGGSG
jgi:hypothetical protein